MICKVINNRRITIPKGMMEKLGLSIGSYVKVDIVPIEWREKNAERDRPSI